MLTTFHTATCAFDCEWVPCADTARRLLNLPPDTPESDCFEALWDYTRKDGDDTPQPFVKLILSKVVSVAFVLRKKDQQTGNLELNLVGLGTGVKYDEAHLIQRFLEGIAEHRYQLWGFNSRGADLPILVQRATALGVSCPKFSAGAKNWDYHHRYHDAHIDILDEIQGFSGAARPSLNELAVACRIPGKLDVAGSEVATMYLDGKLSEIVAYNECDALTTHLLMLRVAYHAGKVQDAAYQAEVDSVRALIDSEIAAGKAHLTLFRDQWAAWEG